MQYYPLKLYDLNFKIRYGRTDIVTEIRTNIHRGIRIRKHGDIQTDVQHHEKHTDRHV